MSEKFAEIRTIYYLPTLRCNCNCKHCGQQHGFLEDEGDPDWILEKIAESRCFKDGMLSVAGGEAFLKKGLPEALANFCNSGKGYVFVTTNGICTEAVRSFCNAVRLKNVGFAVSIDGLPKIHNRIRKNPIAFENAVKTVRLLKEMGFPVQVNTVIQKSNLRSMDKFSQYIKKECGEEVNISWVPEILEMNGREGFPFTKKEAMKIRPYANTLPGILYLESSGKIKLNACHAGQQALVISPSGKVYACSTGHLFRGNQRREDFLMGDLKSCSLDEIFLSGQNEDARYRKAVMECEKCWNPCDVENEFCYHKECADSDNWEAYLDTRYISPELACGVITKHRFADNQIKLAANDIETETKTDETYVDVELENLGKETISSTRLFRIIYHITF